MNPCTAMEECAKALLLLSGLNELSLSGRFNKLQPSAQEGAVMEPGSGSSAMTDERSHTPIPEDDLMDIATFAPTFTEGAPTYADERPPSPVVYERATSSPLSPAPSTPTLSPASPFQPPTPASSLGPATPQHQVNLSGLSSPILPAKDIEPAVALVAGKRKRAARARAQAPKRLSPSPSGLKRAAPSPNIQQTSTVARLSTCPTPDLPSFAPLSPQDNRGYSLPSRSRSPSPRPLRPNLKYTNYAESEDEDVLPKKEVDDCHLSSFDEYDDEEIDQLDEDEDDCPAPKRKKLSQAAASTKTKTQRTKAKPAKGGRKAKAKAKCKCRYVDPFDGKACEADFTRQADDQRHKRLGHGLRELLLIWAGLMDKSLGTDALKELQAMPGASLNVCEVCCSIAIGALDLQDLSPLEIQGEAVFKMLQDSIFSRPDTLKRHVEKCEHHRRKVNALKDRGEVVPPHLDPVEAPNLKKRKGGSRK